MLEQWAKPLAVQGRDWLPLVAAFAAALERAADAIKAGLKPLQKVMGAGDPDAGAAYLRLYVAQAADERADPKQMLGPIGESNELSFWPRGTVPCLAMGGDDTALRMSALITAQAGVALAAGNTVLLWAETTGTRRRAWPRCCTTPVCPATRYTRSSPARMPGRTALLTAKPVHLTARGTSRESVAAVNLCLAEFDGSIRTRARFRTAPTGNGQAEAGSLAYLYRFVQERALSVKTTANGGNGSLLSIEESLQL